MIMRLLTARASSEGASRVRWWSAPRAASARIGRGGAELRSASEVALMRKAGGAVALALAEARSACREGVTTGAISDVVGETLARAGARALFPGYVQGKAPPFPAPACVSINEEVVHGVPGSRRVRAGDVVKIDVGACWPDRADAASGGWCADAATTVVVPGGDADRSDIAVRLVNATRSALEHACELMRPGTLWSEVAAAMQAIADAAGLGVVQDYVGHGVGRALHEPPRAPAFWAPEAPEAPSFADFALEAGMTLAVEPIFTVLPGGPSGARRGGRTEVLLLDDCWTVVTKDRSIACHEEHTIVVTPTGGVALTSQVG